MKFMFEDVDKSNIKIDVTADTCNRLFYMARNLAIELALRNIKDFILSKIDAKKHGINLKWSECSRYHCIKVIHTYKTSSLNEETRYIWTTRQLNNNIHGDIGRTVYGLKSITNGEYYACRKPKLAIELDDLLGEKGFEEFVSREINNCNYPFAYTSYSSVG